MSGFPFQTATVSSGDDILASQYNNLRADIATTFQEDIEAGEGIAGATAPIPCLIVNDIHQREYRANIDFGDIAANTRLSVQIIPQAEITSDDIRLILRKVGSPTGNLTVEVQGDSAGDPDGTAITNGTSNNVAMSGLATSYGESTFAFASAFTLAAGTTYHLVLKRSDAVNASDYVEVLGITNDYANFVGKKYSGSAWSSGSLIYAEVQPTTGYSRTAWKSDANVVGLHWFDGFAVTTATTGNDVTIQKKGLCGGFSNLIAGRKYLVQDTVGTVGTATGTYEVGVGVAVSDTEIFIEKYENEYIGQTTSVRTGTTAIAPCISGARTYAVTQSFSTTSTPTVTVQGFAGRVGGFQGIRGWSQYYNATTGVATVTSTIYQCTASVSVSGTVNGGSGNYDFFR